MKGSDGLTWIIADLIVVLGALITWLCRLIDRDVVPKVMRWIDGWFGELSDTGRPRFPVALSNLGNVTLEGRTFRYMRGEWHELIDTYWSATGIK